MATVSELRKAHDERMAEKEVLSIAYHRNGISGDGFYVALIRDPDVERRAGQADADHRVFVAIVPAWAVGDDDTPAVMPPSGCVPCYVIDPELASGPWYRPGSIAFGENSWRGDHYFALVCEAARAYNEQPTGGR